MKISKKILMIYIKIRQIIKKFLFFLFSENSKIINIFVDFDIFFRKLGFLDYFLKGKFEYDGLIFYHDLNDSSVASSILTNNTYEPELLKEIKSTLKNGSTFIDGGANIGFFSLIASKIIKHTGVVIAFEPTPLTSKYLKKNIKINNVSNIIISNNGLSSSKKKLPFLLSNNPEGNSIVYSNEAKSLQSGNKIIEINTITIDGFCEKNNIKKIDLIKLDIEGQELEAIKGAKEILLTNKDIKIIFELNIAYNKNGVEFAKEIFTELKKLNFSNFEALLTPRISIKDLNTSENIKLLKDITNRHNVNILATR